MAKAWDKEGSHVYGDELKYIPKRILIKDKNIWSIDYIWTRPKILNKKVKKIEIDKNVLYKLMDDISSATRVAPPIVLFDIDNGRMRIKQGSHKIKVAKSLRIRYIPILIFNMKGGKIINPSEIEPYKRYWKYIAFGDYKMDSPENILTEEQTDKWKSRPELITMKQMMVNSSWQEVMKSMHGNWKKKPEENLRILRKYLGDMKDKLKVFRVYTYLTGTGFENGTIKHQGIDQLLSMIRKKM